MNRRLKIALSRRITPKPIGITLVQDKFYASTANAASHSIVADSGPTNGNLMILVAVCDTTVTTPAGWTLVVSTASNTDNYIFRKTAGASESSTITVSILSSDTCALYFAEVFGLTSNLDDQSTGVIAQGATTSISTGTTAATTVAKEFVIAVGALWINTFTQSFTAVDNGFSFRGTISSSNGGGIDNVTVGIGTKIISATGTQTCNLTTDTSIGLNNSGLIATFK